MLLRILHAIGLTNFSDEEVDSYELHSLAEKVRKYLAKVKTKTKTKFFPYFEKYFSFELSVEELGRIERDLKCLRRVIVLADHVEDPQGSLDEAVKDNMENDGVEYLFLVSASKAIQELESYYLIFEARAKIASKRLGVEKDKIINIKKLPFDWNNYPYILYQCISDESSSFVTYAFRGNKIGRGIGEYYESVAGADAHTIALAITSEAPLEIRDKLSPDNNRFEDGKNGILFAQHSKDFGDPIRQLH